jgi:hypothetical protein
LDPDVASALEQAVRERRVSFKKVLNDAVRAGLRLATEPRRYRLPTQRMGLRPDVDLDRALALALALAADLEDREVTGKLELRK